MSPGGEHHITPCVEAAAGTQVSLYSYQPPWSLVSAASKTKPGYRSPPLAHGQRVVPSLFALAVPTDFIWAGRTTIFPDNGGRDLWALRAPAAGFFQCLLCRLVTMRDPTTPWAPGAQRVLPGSLAGSLICSLKHCFLTAFLSCIHLVKSI